MATDVTTISPQQQLLLPTYKNRANIDMKLIFTWLLKNVKLSSCCGDADGQAPNTTMAYI